MAERSDYSATLGNTRLRNRVIESNIAMRMAEPVQDECGKCGAEIDAGRRIDFTLKDGTRVCDSCFVKGTARPTHPSDHSDD
jgi:hypothetical protein